MFTIAPASYTQAAAKTPAGAYDGKWTYYSVYGTIYKLNSETGASQQVATVEKAFETHDITYNNGYLYFTTNYYMGTDATDYYVCRMKPDGTSFKKLAKGCSPMVYNNKIYYFKMKQISEDGYVYEEKLGIAEMSLTGKNSKLLVKEEEAQRIDWGMTVADGNVYYTRYSMDDSKAVVYAYSLKDKKSKQCFDAEAEVSIVDSDAAYLYCNMDSLNNDIVAVYQISTGKLMTKEYTGAVNVIGGKDGTVYFSQYSTRTTYAFDAKNNKISTVVKKYLTRMMGSKSGYNVYTYGMSEKEFEASGYQCNLAIVRMKSDGTGYKILKKFYES